MVSVGPSRAWEWNLLAVLSIPAEDLVPRTPELSTLTSASSGRRVGRPLLPRAISDLSRAALYAPDLPKVRLASRNPISAPYPTAPNGTTPPP